MAPLLPIFPLDTVLLPGAPLPLHIFEPRYRALLADVRSVRGSESDSAGFGIVSVDRPDGRGEVSGPGRRSRPDVVGRHSLGDEPDVGALAAIGTFASIIEIESYEDGRSDLLTIGRGRFRILEVVATGKPYLQARVEWLPEEEGLVSDALGEAARNGCTRYLSALAELAGRELPTAAFAADPLTLSYQVAGRMRLANSERQQLLEAATAGDRLRLALTLLRREVVLLTHTRSVAVSPGLLQLETRPN